MVLVDGGSGVQRVGAQKQGIYQCLETLLPQWIGIDAVSHAFEVYFNPILATLAATNAAFSFGTQDRRSVSLYSRQVLRKYSNTPKG